MSFQYFEKALHEVFFFKFLLQVFSQLSFLLEDITNMSGCLCHCKHEWVNPSNAEDTFSRDKDTKLFEYYLNPFMLVFIR